MQPGPAPLTILLLLYLALPGQSQGLQQKAAPTYVNCSQNQAAHELVRSVPGSVDKEGVCYCVVHLPSNRMALQQLEQLESMAQALMGKYEQELSRVSEYMRVIEDQNNHVPEMNRVLEPRNPTMLASSYEAPAFNLLRLELEWALEMVTQLKAKGRVSGAKDLLYQLQGQVANASLTARLLADSNRHSFRALHEEVDVLKGVLSQCEREKEQEASRNTGPYLPPG